jgi:hypothetical protein
MTEPPSRIELIAILAHLAEWNPEAHAKIIRLLDQPDVSDSQLLEEIRRAIQQGRPDAGES